MFRRVLLAFLIVAATLTGAAVPAFAYEEYHVIEHDYDHGRGPRLLDL